VLPHLLGRALARILAGPPAAARAQRPRAGKRARRRLNRWAAALALEFNELIVISLP